MSKTPRCPTHGCACSTAYRKRRCRCAQCVLWKSLSRKPLGAVKMCSDPDESTRSTPERTVDGRLVRSLDDLVARLELDMDAVEVKRFWVKSMNDGARFNVSAQIEPKPPLSSESAVEKLFDEFVEMVGDHGPDESVLPQPRPYLNNPDRPQMFEMILVDPHLGMLAWGKEVGLPYDLGIGLADYRRAFNELLGWARLYNIEEVLIHVGHDLFHVDGTLEGGKGATTTKGTQQDFDTRLARMFVKVEKLIVECIEDTANTFPKVTVQMTPGNHDRHTVFKLGRVLNAWFRDIPHVEIRNKPSVRDYYGYGKNVFMFTHGEEFNRNRDNLATIFATECPPELWVKGKVREIHVGHNHSNKQKVWDGKSVDEVWEGRAIRARSLPGLTPEDSWHFESGYYHRRRATVMVWDREGGMAGYHEVTL